MLDWLVVYIAQNGTSLEPDHKVSSSKGGQYVLAGHYGTLTDNGAISSLSFVFRDKESTEQYNTVAYRVTILIGGIWWCVIYMAFPFRFLLNRPGPPLPIEAKTRKDLWIGYLTFGISQVYQSFKEAKRYPNLFMYLICFFMYSDSVNTLAVTSYV